MVTESQTLLSQISNILPFLLMVVFGITILIIDLFSTSEKRKYLGYLNSFFLAIILVSLLKQFLYANNVTVFKGYIVIDKMGLFLISIVVISALLVSLISIDYLEKKDIHIGEFYMLLLFSLSGMFLIVSTNNLFMIFVALELFSLPLYVLAGLFRNDKRSIEASFKYFIMGSIASAIYLYGVALIYGIVGKINIIGVHSYISSNYDSFTSIVENDKIVIFAILLILIGFLFKIAIIPFHMWLPDLYEGAPSNIVAFMSFSVKVVMVGAFIRVFGAGFNLEELIYNNLGAIERFSWINILHFLTIITIIISSLIALSQRDIKRMLGYSAIAHGGYIIIGVITYILAPSHDSYSSIMFYFLTYLFANIGFWSAISIIETKDNNSVRLEDLNGLGNKTPFISISILIFTLSLAGIPPTAGFMGKFYIFKTAYINGGLKTAVIISLIMSVISVFYYLRVVVYIYMKTDISNNDKMDIKGMTTKFVLAISIVFTLVLGIFPDKYILIIKNSFFNMIGG